MIERILHVVGGMNRGGVETWLMHVLRHTDRERSKMDFMVHTNKPCAYDEEIRSLGSKIIPCLYPHRPWKYARNFRRVIQEHGPYDIIHSHVHHFSGYVLRLAHKFGVPIRIAHSHSDTLQIQENAGFVRKIYLFLMKAWIKRYATIGLAASQKAAIALFGANWESDPLRHILYYGIDVSAFYTTMNRKIVRAELGLDQDAFVIGHVGRFDKPKNHTFLIDVFAEIFKQEPKARLLLVGDGKLRFDMEQKTERLGLKNNVIFTGVRSDIPRLMMGAMDIFVFPSLFEGLPVVLIEAQTAGLSCVISDSITEEVDLVQPLIQRLSLSLPHSIWAEAILKAKSAKQLFSQSDSLAIVENSDFNIEQGIKKLEGLYASNCD